MDDQPNYDPKKWVVYSSKIGESRTIEAQRTAVTAAAKEAGATIEASFCIEGFENDNEGKAHCSEMFNLAVNYALRRRAVLVMPCLTVVNPIFNVLQRQLFDRHVPAKILGLPDEATRSMFSLGYECATFVLKYQQQAASDCQQDKDTAAVEADAQPAAKECKIDGEARIERIRREFNKIFAASREEELRRYDMRILLIKIFGYNSIRADFLISFAAKVGIIKKNGIRHRAPYTLVEQKAAAAEEQATDRAAGWRKEFAQIFAAAEVDALQYSQLVKLLKVKHGYSYTAAEKKIKAAVDAGVIYKTSTAKFAPYKLTKK